MGSHRPHGATAGLNDKINNYNYIINDKTGCYCARRLYPTQLPSMKLSLLSGLLVMAALGHTCLDRLERTCENKDNTDF